MSEIIINSLDFENGPAPKLLDVKHLTNILSSDAPNEIYADASFLCQGPIEATAETCVYIDWPKQYRIPVFIKAVIRSFSAKLRIKYTSSNPKENWIQWIGKPKLRLSLEPKIGSDFELKSSLPRVKMLIDEFV